MSFLGMRNFVSKGMELSLCINKKEERDAALLVPTGTEWDD